MNATQERTNIGRMAYVLVGKERQKVYGNVIDLVAGTNDPKRIRIQAGAPTWQGDVVMPTMYEFLFWADEEED